MSSIAITGDIPFGKVKSRQMLPDRTWLAPQGSLQAVGEYEKELKTSGQKPDPARITELINGRRMLLEAVELENGLPYAVIRDAITGKEAFDYHQYGGLISCNCGAIHNLPCVEHAEIIKGTNLGNGYKVNMMVAGYGTGLDDKEPMSSTYAEKELKAPDNASHNFWYNIDPHRQRFTGEYKYKLAPESSITRMDWLQKKPDFQHKLKYSVLIADHSNNWDQSQVNFVFDNTGRLTQVQLLRDAFGLENTKREISTLREFPSDRDGWLVLEDQNLNLPEVRELVKKLLGVEYGNTLVIDTKDSLNKLLRNIDSQVPQNPRKILSFVDAELV